MIFYECPNQLICHLYMYHTMLGYCICLGFCSPKKAMPISVISPAGYFLINLFFWRFTFTSYWKDSPQSIFIIHQLSGLFVLYINRIAPYNDNDNDNDKKNIVSSGFNIFNTFINLYDQGFILNHRRPYIISKHSPQSILKFSEPIFTYM